MIRTTRFLGIPNGANVSATATQAGQSASIGPLPWGVDPATLGPPPAILNAWAGRATATDATVAYKFNGEALARVAVSTSPDLSSPIYSPYAMTATGAVIHKVSGLTPNTQYHFGVEANGVLQPGFRGRIRTGGANSFRFGLASCSGTPTSDVALWLVQSGNLDFFVHTGDLHYVSVNTTNEATYESAINGALTGDQGNLLRNVSTLYMWDDHDFCGNNSDGSALGRDAALAVHRRRVPLVNADRWFQGPTDPVGFTYVRGRVRFLVPDARSRKLGNAVWGAAQQQRIFDEITAARAAGQVVVLVATYVLTGNEFPAPQRVAFADHIRAQNMQGSVAVISGDAHMVAFDSGVNNDFATGGGAPLPSFVAAPLNQGNSVKGGPWSGGTFVQSENQAGVFDVADTGGSTITFTMQGVRDAGIVMATFSATLQVP